MVGLSELEDWRWGVERTYAPSRKRDPIAEWTVG